MSVLSGVVSRPPAHLTSAACADPVDVGDDTGLAAQPLGKSAATRLTCWSRPSTFEAGPADEVDVMLLGALIEDAAVDDDDDAWWLPLHAVKAPSTAEMARAAARPRCFVTAAAYRNRPLPQWLAARLSR